MEKPTLFISYSHKDARFGRRLHRRLESYRVPRRLVGRETPRGPVPARLAPIFRDREELPAAHDLSAEVRAALARSETLIVICSPNAAQSKYVNEEIRRFKMLGGGTRVLPVIFPAISSTSAVLRYCTHSRHRTIAVTCPTSRCFTSAGSLIAEADRLATSGTTGGRSAVSSSAFSIALAAGAISGEWKGALTGRIIDRRAPRSRAIAIARSMAWW